MTTQDCLFCKIVSGEIQTKNVLENDQVVAFWDQRPQAERHLLIVPKKHIVGTEAVSPDDGPALVAVFAAAQQLDLENNLAGDYKLIVNGPKLRHVDHLHFHFLGGKVRSHP